MVSEIFKQNGTVDKFIGDAVMAFWNAPLPIENHELCAIKAAIGTQEALEKFNKEHGVALKMGIGIHSGFAVVGNIGGSERISYTALGDSVNTTSRIEGITKKYGVNILISGEVVGAIKKVDIPGWRLRKVDEVLLKGKQKSVLLYEVTQLKEDVVTLYEKALSLYQSSSFGDAQVLLKSEILREDMPSRILLERIENNSVPENFNGVWMFDQK
jgi:adenylate cyclase